MPEKTNRETIQMCLRTHSPVFGHRLMEEKNLHLSPQIRHYQISPSMAQPDYLFEISLREMSFHSRADVSAKGLSTH